MVVVRGRSTPPAASPSPGSNMPSPAPSRAGAGRTPLAHALMYTKNAGIQATMVELLRPVTDGGEDMTPEVARGLYNEYESTSVCRAVARGRATNECSACYASLRAVLRQGPSAACKLFVPNDARSSLQRTAHFTTV